MHFSNDYGFGLVDALTAVRLAEEAGIFSDLGEQVDAVAQRALSQL